MSHITMQTEIEVKIKECIDDIDDKKQNKINDVYKIETRIEKYYKLIEPIKKELDEIEEYNYKIKEYIEKLEIKINFYKMLIETKDENEGIIKFDVNEIKLKIKENEEMKDIMLLKINKTSDLKFKYDEINDKFNTRISIISDIFYLLDYIICKINDSIEYTSIIYTDQYKYMIYDNFKPSYIKEKIENLLDDSETFKNNDKNNDKNNNIEYLDDALNYIDEVCDMNEIMYNSLDEKYNLKINELIEDLLNQGYDEIKKKSDTIGEYSKIKYEDIEEEKEKIKLNQNIIDELYSMFGNMRFGLTNKCEACKCEIKKDTRLELFYKYKNLDEDYCLLHAYIKMDRNFNRYIDGEWHENNCGCKICN